MQIQNRRDLVFILLSGIFITNAILGELIGVKLIQLGPFTMSIGVVLWPVVFLTTDLINEYFGIKGVKRLTLVTMAMIMYCFIIIYFAMRIPSASSSPVSDSVFNKVFGQGLWIIFGSLIAFALSQFIDVFIFWIFRHWSQGKMLWLRSTGSTVLSQLFDSFVIIAIAFWLPGKISTEEFFQVASSNYMYKLIIAVSMTPLIYLAHNFIDRFLGKEESHRLIQKAAKESPITIRGKSTTNAHK